MVVLLNNIVFIAIAVTLLLLWLLKGKQKLIPVVLFVLFLFVYKEVQPSYMPKGKVPTLPPIEHQVVDKPIVDRSLQVESFESRDKRLKAEFEESEKRINDFVEKAKKEKQTQP